MSQSDSESNIWDYKPLQKTRKQQVNCSVTPRKKHTACYCTPSRSLGRGKIKKCVERPTGGSSDQRSPCVERAKVSPQDGRSIRAECHQAHKEVGQKIVSRDAVLFKSSATQKGAVAVDGRPSVSCGDTGEQLQGSSDEFCPSCQMPFSMLLGQSRSWHVTECLEDSTEKEECPEGLTCSSTIPSHYKKYSHFLLAQTRATNDGNVASLEYFSEGVASTSSSSPSPGQQCGPDSSSASTQSNVFHLLRSPTSEDIRKRKGWFTGSKNISRKSRAPSTPSYVSHGSEAVKSTLTPANSTSVFNFNSGGISYSPLSVYPGEVKVFQGETIPSRKSLFNDDNSNIKGAKEDLSAFCSALDFSEDELLAELLSQSEVEDDPTGLTSLSLDNCFLNGGETGIKGPNQPKAAIQKEEAVNTTGEDHDLNLAADEHEWCSPESLVLEHLRDHLQSRAKDSGLEAVLKQEPPLHLTQEKQDAVNMAPRKTQVKLGSSGLKQTDIGVFFGLKPLKKDELQPEVLLVKEDAALKLAAVPEGQKTSGRRQRKRKATSSLGDSNTEGVAGNGNNSAAKMDAGAQKPRGRRWARGRNEDSLQQVKRCPFYKKIPGTGFVVDAFQYGTIQGVTCYFLTHFHSDHYGGLNRTSTLPIYCNQITGNLVKSKLRIDEQYIHILPMNTACLVEGVTVILLDANHCPGASMLLFILPDGQTVLHTGDFRADPSMERYPELQCHRVQTLYLDTTYCSPEYTFPSQQQVITFVANMAFEYVTLHPRTLVVCGAYSVGKEKVFLALAEVLGCKAGMSRDKFGIMSCLELEQLSQLVTTDWSAARGLRTHLRKFAATYDQVLAFKPTGWTFSSQFAGVEDIRPEVQDNIAIYGIPYSEHSSYLEMKRFVQWLKPDKIIPTVNVGSWARRKGMERIFRDWKEECNG
ncbi:DNA cross-link repair 1A protein-like [Arapaima gigas]